MNGEDLNKWVRGAMLGLVMFGAGVVVRDVERRIDAVSSDLRSHEARPGHLTVREDVIELRGQVDRNADDIAVSDEKLTEALRLLRSIERRLDRGGFSDAAPPPAGESVR